MPPGRPTKESIQEGYNELALKNGFEPVEVDKLKGKKELYVKARLGGFTKAEAIKISMCNKVTALAWENRYIRYRPDSDKNIRLAGQAAEAILRDAKHGKDKTAAVPLIRDIWDRTHPKEQGPQTAVQVNLNLQDLSGYRYKPDSE